MVGFAIYLSLSMGGSPALQEIDGEDAVQIVQKFAREVGIRGKLDLSSLSKIDGERWRFGSGKYFAIGFSISDHRSLNSYVAPTGEIQLFQVVSPPPTQVNSGVSRSVRGSRNAQPSAATWIRANVNLKDSRIIPMAKRFLMAAHPTGAYEFRPLPTGQSGSDVMCYFDVTVNGHKFFNLNPTYGYRVDLNVDRGELTYFSRPSVTPSVVASEPKISSAKAASMLRHWAKTHYIHGMGVASMYGPQGNWRPSEVVELGYFKFEKERKARLVYQAHVWTHFMNNPSTEAGIIRMYVDAVTGELIAPDDPGMG